MSNVRLQTYPVHIDGVEYPLSCTFNVLYDIEEEYGTINKGLHDPKMYKFLRFVLASMLNNAAEMKGIEQRFTPDSASVALTRNGYDISDMQRKIIQLIVYAVSRPDAKDAEEDDSKN